MNRPLALLLLPLATFAADLTIPSSATRDVVVKSSVRHPAPRGTLPDGFTLSTAAGAPLVTHPIMGCVDPKGRVFIGDAVGVNWTQKDLDAAPPNRVLMLEDLDHDGHYDQSTIFADKMTFPQGACWHDGSLYVCSPPGLWKLTDTNADGIADERSMIVRGFQYTGNAADVHGPFLHPNGRLYWCHGRKGHEVIGKEGHVVHAGLASGIWSCQPDGSDVQWHALGCGDNPVEVDFTPSGDVIGVENLYHTAPRGDTLMHWLPGGVYERRDQLKAIAELPRTLETMPVMHNFGHVAVSGSCFWRAAPMNGLHYLVTHFNTQRLVRMDLTAQGSTYTATENEFIKLANPDIHLTDVMEDVDGSLLILDTGGWFRSGCPSSMMAKPDVLGAIYRVRTSLPAGKHGIAASDAHTLRHHIEQIAAMQSPSDADRATVMAQLAQPMDAVLEHTVMHAVIAHGWHVRDLFAKAESDAHRRRLLRLGSDESDEPAHWTLHAAAQCLASNDEALLDEASRQLAHPGNDPDTVAEIFAQHWQAAAQRPALRAALTPVAVSVLAKGVLNDVITAMVAGPQQAWALDLISQANMAEVPDAWLQAMKRTLAEPTTLRALKLMKSHPFDADLEAITQDKQRSLLLRMLALEAMKKAPESAWLHGVVDDAATSPTARLQALSLLTKPPLPKAKLLALMPHLPKLGPLEFKTILDAMRGHLKDADVAQAFTTALVKSPSLGSVQESIFRTLYADQATLFEQTLLPAITKANEALEAKQHSLPSLAQLAAEQGDASRGAGLIAEGKGTCIACHRIGAVGRAIGPDLSKIGSIRNERDLLESILLPSRTLARDYETHIIERKDGSSMTGLIKSHAAEGLIVQDAAGIELTIANTDVAADLVQPTSLMPLGLDTTLTAPELLDIVAYLRSLR